MSTMEVSTPIGRRHNLQEADDRESRDNDELYFGMLRQVSEMTVDDSRLYDTPKVQQSRPIVTVTGVGGLGSIFETPDQSSFASRMYCTPDHHNSSKPSTGTSAFAAAEAKRKPSPMLFGRKKFCNAATPQTSKAADSRLFNAPPLPSSPELSMGRKTHHAVPPQFSPIASLQMIVPPHGTQFPNSGMLYPESVQTPRTMTNLEGSTTVIAVPNPEDCPPPPAMPWMDTPEQPNGSRRVKNQLKMRKRNDAAEIVHSPFSLGTGNSPQFSLE